LWIFFDSPHFIVCTIPRPSGTIRDQTVGRK
jgi:hypothetical protein